MERHGGWSHWRRGMSPTRTQDLCYSIDHVCWRGDCVFGWGWLLSRARRVRTITLLMTYEDSIVEHISLPHGSARADVAVAFPDVPHATSSGFLLAARLRQEQEKLRASSLLVTFDDGSNEEVQLQDF